MGRVGAQKIHVLSFIIECNLKQVSFAYIGNLTHPGPGTVFSALSEKIMCLPFGAHFDWVFEMSTDRLRHAYWLAAFSMS